jgi:hypothetical protein
MTVKLTTVTSTLTNPFALDKCGQVYDAARIAAEAGCDVRAFYATVFDVTPLGPSGQQRHLRASTISLDLVSRDEGTFQRSKAALNLFTGGRYSEKEPLFKIVSPSDLWAAGAGGPVAGPATHGLWVSGPTNNTGRGDLTPLLPLLRATAANGSSIVEGAMTTGPQHVGPHRTTLIDPDAVGRFDLALMLLGGKQHLPKLISRCSQILRAYEARSHKAGCLGCALDIQLAQRSDSGEWTFFNGLP